MMNNFLIMIKLGVPFLKMQPADQVGDSGRCGWPCRFHAMTGGWSLQDEVSPLRRSSTHAQSPVIRHHRSIALDARMSEVSNT